MIPFFLDRLFEQFCKERLYVKNSSHHTILFCQQSFKAFKRFVDENIQELNKSVLNEFVLSMREKEVKPSTCNVYIRGMNSFLSWLHENEHLTEPLKIKQLKAIFSFKPKSFTEQRLHALLCLLIDTGVRVSWDLLQSP